MKVKQALELIERGLADPVVTWPGYSPAAIPLAVFDDDDVAYLNRPC